jgi:hypothetical protein
MKFLTTYVKLEGLKNKLYLSLQHYKLKKLKSKEELEKKEKLLKLKKVNLSLLHLQVIELNRCKPHPMLNNCNH